MAKITGLIIKVAEQNHLDEQTARLRLTGRRRMLPVDPIDGYCGFY